MKHNQIVRHVKQNRNSRTLGTFSIVAKGRCYVKQKFTKKTKNSQYIVTLTMEDMFGEQNFMDDDHKSLREAFEKYINST